MTPGTLLGKNYLCSESRQVLPGPLPSAGMSPVQEESTVPWKEAEQPLEVIPQEVAI